MPVRSTSGTISCACAGDDERNLGLSSPSEARRLRASVVGFDSHPLLRPRASLPSGDQVACSKSIREEQQSHRREDRSPPRSEKENEA